MDLLELIWHVLNFCAPAVVVGTLLGMAGLRKPRAQRLGLLAQVTLNVLCGLAALGASAWWLARDGKTLGYAAMVVAIALMQWVGTRQWR